jgi:hypothetical protein
VAQIVVAPVDIVDPGDPCLGARIEAFDVEAEICRIESLGSHGSHGILPFRRMQA